MKKHCDNTDHKGEHKNIKEVKMKEEFGNEAVSWCEDCIETDSNFIKSNQIKSMKKQELRKWKKSLFKIYSEPEREDDAFIDDNSLHVRRDGLRFVFYNGQVEKEDEDLPIFNRKSHLKKAVEVVEDLLI